jgi:hypothetical protein
MKPLETAECPFANLPEKKAGRWGAGLTAEKMKECRWLKPDLVGSFEFVEWTADAYSALVNFGKAFFNCRAALKSETKSSFSCVSDFDAHRAPAVMVVLTSGARSPPRRRGFKCQGRPRVLDLGATMSLRHRESHI